VRILVVDDDRDARVIYKSILAFAGASVVAVSSAAAAIKILRHAHLDVVISDLAMPGRDGRWLLQWIRARDAKTAARLPVIAATALGGLSTRAETGPVGFDDYLTKPIALPDVVRSIERLTARPLRSARSA
jgi:CheY-like chemotaxis protein